MPLSIEWFFDGFLCRPDIATQWKQRIRYDGYSFNIVRKAVLHGADENYITDSSLSKIK